ncbi:MAG: cell division protein ZipA C-terminal FtsZ-binding domain-containing protein [Betaproteobacteria bacterium]|nr:cell division protein ZipA C-terminal FtsZ-binding domain-containing protein [Betaproteobacteria bacterium]MDH5221345.1 cell division protein ZipA C-terminal FtsZ-binding domain-containing protein [Betaproteobacteria bacterium]MDH5350347.1 cell division protein ZipA C-terminal FtsZ-binding domain-containing protein [Betaproteobacteria bacterium]
MSDLQIGLLAVGVLVVALILGYNALQERKARRHAEQIFGSRHADVLMEEGASRQEPRFDASARRVHAHDAPQLPDQRLDYVIELSLPQQVQAAEVAAHWAPFEHRFAGRALLAGSTDGAAWRPLAGAAGCAFVRAALQLASRGGPASEAQLIEFRAAVDSLAAPLRASVSAPEVKQAVDAARELDALCAETDIQIVLHVVPPAGESFAADAPLPEGAPFACTRGEGGSYVLALDVPRVAAVRHGYEAMVLHARDLAARLGGTIVDDNAQALDERALAAIGAQLEGICRTLEARGIEPGGPAALRLFS